MERCCSAMLNSRILTQCAHIKLDTGCMHGPDVYVSNMPQLPCLATAAVLHLVQFIGLASRRLLHMPVTPCCSQHTVFAGHMHFLVPLNSCPWCRTGQMMSQLLSPKEHSRVLYIALGQIKPHRGTILDTQPNILSRVSISISSQCHATSLVRPFPWQAKVAGQTNPLQAIAMRCIACWPG